MGKGLNNSCPNEDPFPRIGISDDGFNVKHGDCSLGFHHMSFPSDVNITIEQSDLPGTQPIVPENTINRVPGLNRSPKDRLNIRGISVDCRNDHREDS